MTATATWPELLHDRPRAPCDTRVRERIQGALVRADITFPAGEVAVRIDDHQGIADTLDLATVCAIFTAAGGVDRYAPDA
ncbi:hypothetical protein [Streptomyces nodosus]|uniref:hypothetical protein n=1 Tax=Streptomyces nodosus TaxID=40318 RepID=UPI0037F715AA